MTRRRPPRRPEADAPRDAGRRSPSWGSHDDAGSRAVANTPGDVDEGERWVVGRRAVVEALRAVVSGDASGAPPIERVLLALDAGTAGWWAQAASRLAREAHVVVQRVPRTALDRRAPGVVHQGVMATLGAQRYVELAEVLERAAKPALLVLADGVEDPRNLGALIRSAAAAGADGVILPERRAAGLTPAAAKAAAGALERIPIARVKNLQRALEALSSAGIWTVALDPEASVPWHAVDLARPTCLVVGSEGRGLSRLAAERSDVRAALPLSRGVESLNVSVAVGIVLYEAVRQRTGGAR